MYSVLQSKRTKFTLVFFVLSQSLLPVFSFHLPKNPGLALPRQSHVAKALPDPSILMLPLESLASPYATAALTCGVKASAADYVAQRKDDRKTDLRRNFGFALYGALYQGMALEHVYNRIYPVVFGDGTGILTVAAKVAFDLLIQSVFLTLPLAYLIKGWFNRRSSRQSLRNYSSDVRNKGLLHKYFSFWGPAQFLTFSIIPEKFRISFIAFLSFFWMIVLSRLSSSRPATCTDGQ